MTGGRCWLGIDPGVGGAIAWINAEGDGGASKMPGTPRDIFECIRDVVVMSEVHVALEDLSGGAPRGPGGKALQTPRTQAVLHRNWGHAEMALVALQAGGERLTYEPVRPQTWRKAIGLPPAEDAQKRKRAAKALAQSLFPHIDVTLQLGDALCLAHYARRVAP